MICPALVRLGRAVGMWISHAYVDSPASLAGGRRMWGVPKALATFAWAGAGVTVTREDGTALMRSDLPQPRTALPIPGVTASIGTTGGADRRVFPGWGPLRMAPRRIAVEVPPASPFADLGLGGRRPALAGRADFRLRAPRVLS